MHGIWAVIHNQMITTDDSFTFSKTLNLIKEMISDLPQLYSIEEENIEEEALTHPYSTKATNAPQDASKEESKNIEVSAGVNRSTTMDDGTADRSIDKLVAPPVWSEMAVVAQRRAALVGCIECSKECYGRAWARTSVDLLIDHAAKHAADQNQRFLPSQRLFIQEMVRFVRDQKATRKLVSKTYY